MHTAVKYTRMAVLLAAATYMGNLRAATLNTIWSFQGPQTSLRGAVLHSGSLYTVTYQTTAYGSVVEVKPPVKAGGVWREAVLYNFQGGADGFNPNPGLAFDADGALYGTTNDEGGGGCALNGGCGTVYQLTPPAKAGGAWKHTVLYTFTGAADGFNPGPLTFWNGSLYGFTSNGGNGNPPGDGTIFQVTPPAVAGNPWTFATIYSFSGSDGSTPYGPLTFDSSGLLYGTTINGGTNGTIFRLTPPSVAGGAWTESTLYSFSGTDGSYPNQGVTIGAKGVLYGVTGNGGAKFDGTVFALTPPAVAGGAWTETTLYTFSGADGHYPNSPLIVSRKGVLYGSTQYGGSSTACGTYGCGLIFQLTPPASPGGAWTEATIHQFVRTRDGFNPAGIVSDTAGGLYGTSADAGVNGPVFQLKPGAGGTWIFKVLANIAKASDAATPYSTPVSDSSGALYVTTNNGGVGECAGGCGAVVKLTPPAAGGSAWSESILYSFKGDSDGANPNAGMVFDSAGALYGTTSNGGSTGCAGNGCGTVFKLTPPAHPKGPWRETILYAFGSAANDGKHPDTPLVFDAGGALYGGTSGGGASSACKSAGCGTVFQLTPPAAGGAWTEAVLYGFTGGADGQDPVQVLFQGGSLYGITFGATSGYGRITNRGTVFQLAPPAVGGGAWTETVLHTFGAAGDASNPWSMIADGSGGLYAVTVYGGSACTGAGCGTAIHLTPPAAGGSAWTESILFSFPGAAGGQYPYSLVLNAGTLEGTTLFGGDHTCNCGTVYQLTAGSGSWTESVLHSYTGGDGADPQSIMLNAGALYGVTSAGGTANFGTVFQVQ